MVVLRIIPMDRFSGFPHRDSCDEGKKMIRFVDRRRELRELGALLERESGQSVTVYGGEWAKSPCFCVGFNSLGIYAFTE